MELHGAIRFWLSPIAHELFSPGSILSIYSLATTFCIAVLALAYRHKARRGRANLRAIARATFNLRLLRHASSYADVKLVIVSVVIAPPIFASLVLSSNAVSMAVSSVLRSVFGPIWSFSGHDAAMRALSTLALFLAYEIGYFVDHYLKHRVPFLWALHKVHHTAEVLTPLTNYRNHPVDNLIFGYMLSIFIGGASGVLGWMFDRKTDIISVDGRNVIFLIFLWTIGHLQHSQFWIPFGGIWGRLFMSPAHHQIHHSDDPRHFNRNLGSVLAIWDWMFGTLETPSVENPRLAYGVREERQQAHSWVGLLVSPLVEAGSALSRALIAMKRSFRRRTSTLADVHITPRV
ncbi:sterol desaturase family protein [Methylocystis bryophila]|uniref:Fatty acid hydroxylase n=1 Tax=Methylocystis bryophila TaxID=655015 RepID=A0A1W6MTY1_9HYPH|nr:sterol desaturase family protein [Methylocystis bryophila]ARN80949.1 fatty acid hydroxylase [Methylocystis bryophila]BDV36853.1 sterol desaturase [Methylocystis bryophila]